MKQPQVWSAPGRVNLIGEHTDYNDGFVLPLTIQHRTDVELDPARRSRHPRPRRRSTIDAVEVALDDLDDFFPARRDEDHRSGRVTRSASPGRWFTPPRRAPRPPPPAWSCGSRPRCPSAPASPPPLRSRVLPPRAQRGVGPRLDDVTLAQVGRRAENEAVGAPTGIMDQMASMLGRANAAIFLDCRSLDAKVVAGFAAAGLSSRHRRRREALARDRRLRRAPRGRASSAPRSWACRRCAMCRVDDLPRAAELHGRRHVPPRAPHRDREPARARRGPAAPRARPARSASSCGSHVSMRDDFEISVPELDTAVDAHWRRARSARA